MRAMVCVLLAGCSAEVVCVDEAPACPGGDEYVSCCTVENCWYLVGDNVAIYCDGVCDEPGCVAGESADCANAIEALVDLTCPSV
jgi:hypothetical protein